MARENLMLMPVTRSFTVLNQDLNKINAQLRAGDDVVFEFTVVDSDGNAVDISSWSVLDADFYDSAGASQIAKNGAFVTDGTDGKFDVTLAPADTASLVGMFTLEIEVDNAGGTLEYTPIRGRIQIVETWS